MGDLPQPSHACGPAASIPTFTRACAGTSRRMTSITCRRLGAVIGQPSHGFSNVVRLASVTDTANSFLPTSIATATVAVVTGQHEHSRDPPPGVLLEDHGAATPRTFQMR